MLTLKEQKQFKANIWKTYLYWFMTNLHFIGGVLMPFFMDWGGLSYTQVMLLQSWFMVCVFLMEIPTGAIADFFGRKASLVLACLFTIAAVFIYTSGPDFYLFLLGEFVWAIGSALISGSDDALVYDSLKKTGETHKSKKVFARMETYALAGLMVAAPIGSLIAAKFGLPATMLLMAVPFSIAFFVALTLKEPKTEKKVESLRYINVIKAGVKVFYHNKTLKILAADMILLDVLAYFMIWVEQPLLKSAGLDIAYFGLIHAMFVGAEIMVMNYFGILERIFGSKKGLLFYSGIILGLMYLLGSATNYLPLVILVIVVGGGFGKGRRPLFTHYLNKHIPSEQRSTTLSTISMLDKACIAVASPLVGLLADWSLNFTLLILGALAVVFAFISRVEEKHLLD